MTRRPAIALVLAGVALAAAPATAGTKKTVKVLDNFYQPSKLTVKHGTTIDWRWPEDGGDVHDVKLVSAPKGVKKFQSDPGSAGFTYKKKLSKPGTYRFICTFHEEDGMKMTIKVKP